MTIIPKGSADTYSVSSGYDAGNNNFGPPGPSPVLAVGPFNFAGQFDINFPSRATYAHSTITSGTIPNIGMSQGRLWQTTIATAGFNYSVSTDLSAHYADVGSFSSSMTSYGPFTNTFTFNGEPTVVTYNPNGRCSVGVVDNGTSTKFLWLSVDHIGTDFGDVVFVADIATPGAAPTYQKAFRWPADTFVYAGGTGPSGILAGRDASPCMVATYKNGSRFKTLIRGPIGDPVASFIWYVVDWTPTDVTNNVFDATITPLTLSAPSDQSVWADPSWATQGPVLTTEFGIYITFISVTTKEKRCVQIAPDFSAYRTISLTGADATATTMIANGTNSIIGPSIDGYNIVWDPIVSGTTVYNSNIAASIPTYEFPKVRAFGFSQDDHDFYVLRLGATESLLYDAVTDQWAAWDGAGKSTWRANYASNWQGLSADTIASGAGSVIVGDDSSGTLWSLDQEQAYDDQVSGSDTDPITTTYTTGIPQRGSTSKRNNRVFLALRTGDEAGSVSLQTSDDGGQTWQSQGTVGLNGGEYNQEVVWRSIGKVTYPGRVYQFDDDGSSPRIDGVDTDLDDEDI